MKENRTISTLVRLGSALLAVCSIATAGARGDLTANRARQLVYDAVAGRSVPRHRPQRPANAIRVADHPSDGEVRASNLQVAEVEPGATSQSVLSSRPDPVQLEPIAPHDAVVVGQFNNVGTDCGCTNRGGCDACCGETDITCWEEACGRCLPGCWTVGAEIVFLQPRFDNNIAFTVMEADGASEMFSDTDFNYDLELNPRVWVGRSVGDDIGWRVTWWAFDHNPAAASTQPPENGFGQVTHPDFGDVDISTTIPTDTFTAISLLNAWTLDFEGVKDVAFCNWRLGIGGGLRYASVEQRYAAELRDVENTLRGQIDFRQALEGFGPTISLAAARPLECRGELFCAARASVLCGDGKSRLDAGEDLDLTTPLQTGRTTTRDDLLTIGEIQVGVRVYGQVGPRTLNRPFLSAALEGQVWNGAGNAANVDGNLGFIGFSIGAGISR